jgi:SAM-dependent methyltransferase
MVYRARAFMIDQDRHYLEALLKRGVLKGPLLELGAGLPEHSARGIVERAGLAYVGTDLEGDVEVRVDFSDGPAVRSAFTGRARFESAIVFNVLEHTFDPIRVLDHVFELLAPGGICVALTPTVWPIHSFPIDCWRVLPDFYTEYARRNGHELIRDTFEYVGFGPVQTPPGGSAVLPNPGRSPGHHLYSRVVHKLFNTAGRSMFMPSHVATAVALRKRAG